MAFFRILSPVGLGTPTREVPLDREVFSIGRELDSALVLGGHTSSRQHARVRRFPEGWMLEDLGSANGTKVQGVRIVRHLLRHGDSVQLGDCCIVFYEGEIGASRPPPLPMAAAPPALPAAFPLSPLPILQSHPLGLPLPLPIRDHAATPPPLPFQGFVSSTPQRPRRLALLLGLPLALLVLAGLGGVLYLQRAPRSTSIMAPGFETGAAAPASQPAQAAGLPEAFSARIAVPGTEVTLASTPGMKNLLSGVTGETLDTKRLALNPGNARFLQGPAYVRGTRSVRLHPPKGYAAGQGLGGTFYLTLPVEEALLQGSTGSNLGVVCATEGWTAFLPGVLDRANHSISVPTNHLSDWFPARQSKAEEMTAFFKQQGLLAAKRAEDWAKDKTGDIILEGVQEFLEANNLDQNTAGKILSSLAKNKESLQQIYEGVSARDVEGAALSTQLLVGKILAENVDESPMAGLLNDLTKHADIAADASQAAGSFAGGDYYKASETIGRIIWKKSAIGPSIDRAIAAESAAWEFLTQHQYQAAYEKYKEQGSDGLVRMFGGPSAYVREKFFKGKSVSDETVAAKMAELFEAAKRREEAANVEQARLEKLYALFEKMEKDGGASGMVADFRRRIGQRGVDGESAVFDEFLHLTRQIKRDLLALGVDPWLPGRTLSSANPDLSKEALALLAAFARGGPAAYKEKLAEIARSRFPKKSLKSDIQKTNEVAFGETSPGGGSRPLFIARTPNLVLDRDDMRWNGTHFTRTVQGAARFGFKPGPQYVGIDSVHLTIEGDVDAAGTRLLNFKATSRYEQKRFKENDHTALRLLQTTTREIELRDFPLKRIPGTFQWEGKVEGAALKGRLLKVRTFGIWHDNYGSGDAPQVFDTLSTDIQSAMVFLTFDPKLKQVTGKK